MSLDFGRKNIRRSQSEPQLAAMIDVFSILIIFLIAGTVMGTTSIALPEGLQPPKSRSNETPTTAPQLTVYDDQVTLGFVDKRFPLQAFLVENSNEAEIERFRSEVKKFLIENDGRPEAEAINFVTDRATPYRSIFEVVKRVREAGFKSILFVSKAQAKK